MSRPDSENVRGVEIDCILIHGAPDLDETVLSALASAGWSPLNSIEDLLLIPTLEWVMPGDRCVALSRPLDGWRIVYDTELSHAALANALSQSFPESLVVQFNLQEQSDFTLRVLKNDHAHHEFSSAPSFFNWGRCLGKAESAELERPDIAALERALGRTDCADTLKTFFEILATRPSGIKKSGKSKRDRTVYDAVRKMAENIGMPRPYRFFEGWMKSTLDWEEDQLANVLTFRKA